MTVLDQAFIKAYLRRRGKPAVATLESPDPKTLEPAGPKTPEDGAAPPAAPEKDTGVFRPLLRIDGVTWPEPSERLCRLAAEQIHRVAATVQRVAESGRILIGVAAFSSGEGCTTVLLALARRLVELGRKTLLLDADVAHPGLPERLGLKVDCGWREVALGRIELEEAVAESDRECLALLPYCGSQIKTDSALPREEAIDCILARLRDPYDVVLIDLGASLTSGGREGVLSGEFAKRMDSVLTVQNVRVTSESQLAMLREHFHRIGVAETGVIENFTDD